MEMKMGMKMGQVLQDLGIDRFPVEAFLTEVERMLQKGLSAILKRFQKDLRVFARQSSSAFLPACISGFGVKPSLCSRYFLARAIQPYGERVNDERLRHQVSIVRG
jgi:hypothetical protein